MADKPARLPVPEIVTLLLWPVALTYLNNTWLFVKPIFIDRWIYSGYHMHLHALLKTHGDEYYSARVPWNVLGWAVHHVLPPEQALYVLHFFVFYLSVFSLFFAVLLLFSDSVAALTAALVLMTQSEFLTATGWDYVDGFYTACIFLGLASIAVIVTGRRYKLAAFLWGLSVTFTVSLYILMVVLVPAEIVAFLLWNRLRSRRPIFTVAVWFVIGILGSALGLACINWLAGGPFLYFIGQVDALPAVAARRAVWFLALSTWIVYATWLLIPVAALLFAILFLARHVLRVIRELIRGGDGSIESSLWVACFAYALGFLAFIALAVFHFSVLQLDDKVNALLPFAFVCVGGAFALVSRQLRGLYRVALGITVVVLSLLPWILNVYQGWLPTAPPFLGIPHEIEWTLAGAVLLICLGFMPRNILSRLAYVLLVVFFVTIGFGGADTNMMQFVPNPYYKEGTLAVFDAIKAVAPYNPDARAKFWFDDKDKFAGLERDVVSSYLYGPSLINEHFPSIEDWRTGAPAKFMPGERVIFLATNGDPVPQANQLVSAQNIVFQEIARQDIARPGISFAFFVTDVRPKTGA